MGFVTVDDGQLKVDGCPLRFMGTNCYFLQEEGTREVLGWEGYAGRVDEALRKAATLELGVVRAWAFNDDPGNPAAIQKAPLQYNEAGLRGMDLVLATAAKRGLRLILSLGNYWNDYGGVPQYLAWHGLGSEPGRFFTNPAIIEHYGDHLENLLRRENHLTGLSWGEDPTVLAWELMNEPRGKGLDRGGKAMLRWIEIMVSRIREVAPNQLIATGEEGLDVEGASDAQDELTRLSKHPSGMDFERNTAAVDLASTHLYPESWGWPSSSVEEAGARWITYHADIAARMGRPLFLGEFGLRNGGSLSLADRRRIYSSWMKAAFDHPTVAGAASWSFSTDDRPDDWDAYTWYLRNGRDEKDPENRYADLHRLWARSRVSRGEGSET